MEKRVKLFQASGYQCQLIINDFIEKTPGKLHDIKMIGSDIMEEMIFLIIYTPQPDEI